MKRSMLVVVASTAIFSADAASAALTYQLEAMQGSFTGSFALSIPGIPDERENIAPIKTLSFCNISVFGVNSECEIRFFNNHAGYNLDIVAFGYKQPGRGGVL